MKCISKSNPLYQEFRLWQFIKRLRIIKKESKNEGGEQLINTDISDSILTIPVKENLFEFINNRKEITQSAILKKLKLDEEKYRWNFEEDHKEPCNETRYDFVLRLKRIKGFNWEKFLNARSKVHKSRKGNDATIFIDGPSNEYLLWNFFYSIKKKDERIKGLPHLIEKLLRIEFVIIQIICILLFYDLIGLIVHGVIKIVINLRNEHHYDHSKCCAGICKIS